ncbi:hypothetical protein Tco_0398240, partial [Tanacetum coccineum]
MQFLMGLDEVYAPIRRIILTNDPIPDVNGAFATLSRDESHRGSQTHSVVKTRNEAFVARPSNRNQPIVSKLNMTVGHANGTKAVVTHVGSLRLTDKIVIHDVLVVPGYEDLSGDWWYDPPMCQRSVQIIPGLLRSRKELEEIISMVEEKQQDEDILEMTQRKAKQANKLSNLTGQRQLLASVNYRRAIIEELERLPRNLVACKTREHLKLIQKVVFVEVIELKKELRLHVLHKIENHVCSAHIWLLIIDTKAQESKNKTIDVT